MPSRIDLGLVLATLAVVAVADPVLAKEKPLSVPQKWPEPEKTVTGCESLGAGYVKLPGSDTCVKVSGRTTVEGGAILQR